MDARNAIEYEVLAKYLRYPHRLEIAFDRFSDIEIRCKHCGDVILVWDKPEREDSDE